MAQARSRESWAHTSAVLALIANVNRDPSKGRAWRPCDFDPHTQARSQAIEVDSGNMGLLKQAFVKTKERES
ncbi:MAG: hypothetical protein LLG01_15955 [Planctomycetaceae bacterium]|nr:hypothetical protein [Planctomycetaceae bacterium]